MQEIKLIQKDNVIYIKSDILHDGDGIEYERLEKWINLWEIVFTRDWEIVTRVEDIMKEIYKWFYWTTEEKQNKLWILKKMVNDLFKEQLELMYWYDREECYKIFWERWIKHYGLWEEGIDTEYKIDNNYKKEEIDIKYKINTEYKEVKWYTYKELIDLWINHRTIKWWKSYYEKDWLYYSTKEMIDFYITNYLKWE